MILLCGIPTEPPMRMAIKAAVQAEISYVVFNQRHCDRYELCLDLGDRGLSGTLIMDGAEYPLEKFAGVYSRMMEPELLPEVCKARNPSIANRFLTMHLMLLEWIEGTPCRVANRIAPMASNTSKPYQAQLIAPYGFRTPDTLVTNDPSFLKEFRQGYDELIYKSISSVRSIVKPLTRNQRLDSIRSLPTQFQERLSGSDIRVHVVGEEVFPTAVETKAVDYRYAGRDDIAVKLSPAHLPKEVEERCRSLSRGLGLPFCGIDLRKTDGGDYGCFEVNPSPAYCYYEQATGQGIPDALVRYLEYGTSRE